MFLNRFALAAALVASTLATAEGKLTATKSDKDDGTCPSEDKVGDGKLGPPQMVLNFNHIDYNWNDEHVEQDYLDSGALNRNVAVITGIKIGPGVKADPENINVFLTVPRWFGGVPSSLNVVKVDMTLDDKDYPIENPVLSPWPSWEMNKLGDCDALQYVQSMEIDNDGLMWVIDTGRVDIFTSADNTCPPKLVIFDVATGEIVGDPYIFPNEVAPYTSVFLNDITIDNINKVAYISDMTGANGDGTNGALIVYDHMTKISKRFVHSTMLAELGLDWVFKGESLGLNTFAQSINGVAVTPDSSRLFYSGLQQSGSTYSVDTVALRNYLVDDTAAFDWAAALINHGPRHSHTDGMTFDCAGNLFHSSLNEGSFYAWDSSSKESPLESGVLAWENTDDTCGMWWTDTYAWDDDDYLWLTADYLPDVFYNGKFTVDNIWRMPTKTGSYQKGPCTIDDDNLEEASPYKFNFVPAASKN